NSELVLSRQSDLVVDPDLVIARRRRIGDDGLDQQEFGRTSPRKPTPGPALVRVVVRCSCRRPKNELLGTAFGCRGARPGCATGSRPLVVHDGSSMRATGSWAARRMIRPRAKRKLNRHLNWKYLRRRLLG